MQFEMDARNIDVSVRIGGSDGVPATLRRRFAAWIVDGAVVTTLILPFGAIFEDVEPGSGDYWLLFGAALALVIAYQAIGNGYGGTVGKRVLGVKVVDVAGGNLGLKRGLLRSIVYLLGGLVFYAGWWSAYFDPLNQTWHDKAVSSLVLRPERTSRE